MASTAVGDPRPSTLHAGPGLAKTLWGLSPAALHEHYWASRGVQVVRQGGNAPIHPRGQLFLLMETGMLAILERADPSETAGRVGPDLVYIRVRDIRQRSCHERVVTDDAGNFVRFERLYDRAPTRLARAAFTSDVTVARAWQAAPTAQAAWRKMRLLTPRPRRAVLSTNGIVYEGNADADIASFLRDLTRCWERPDLAIARVKLAGSARWPVKRICCDAQACIEPGARLIGPIWIGAGRRVTSDVVVIGPTILWDEPRLRPEPQQVQWQSWQSPPRREAAPLPMPGAGGHHHAPPARTASQQLFKRAFDLAFACMALVLTLPVYPLVMLAILFEDGWPVFFMHRRETIGGKEFPCIKFRSMRKDAEQTREDLASRNQADGPQFFMENDPRLTRVGRFLRKYRLDELPQFVNVLLGQMSIVGPRPSPYKENQYCPPWRAARLSVRPGITGLWQISRTRQRGSDFQEWIKYDIEYVETADWALDLKIIWRTILGTLKGGG